MASTAQYASRLFALLVGTIMLSVGIITFNAPKAPSQDLFSFGTGPLTSDNRPQPHVYLFASRETSLGIIMLALIYKRQWNTVGLVLTCLSLCGFADTYLEVLYGSGSWTEALKVHVPFMALWMPAMVVLLRDRNR